MGNPETQLSPRPYPPKDRTFPQGALTLWTSLRLQLPSLQCGNNERILIEIQVEDGSRLTHRLRAVAAVGVSLPDRVPGRVDAVREGSEGVSHREARRTDLLTSRTLHLQVQTLGQEQIQTAISLHQRMVSVSVSQSVSQAVSQSGSLSVCLSVCLSVRGASGVWLGGRPLRRGTS